jgi:transposase
MKTRPAPGVNGYPTDLTDDEWAIIEPHIPPPIHIPNLQEPLHHRRIIVNAIMYVLRSGCQ